MNWLALALMTAIFWGLTYASTEQVTKYMDPKTYLTFSCIFAGILYALWGYCDGTMSKDLSNGVPKGMTFAFISAFSAFVASYCSVAAVKAGGATYASIVEISYPMWVVLFLYLITGVNNLNWNVAVGGVLVFLGTLTVLFGKQQ